MHSTNVLRPDYTTVILSYLVLRVAFRNQATAVSTLVRTTSSLSVANPFHVLVLNTLTSSTIRRRREPAGPSSVL